MPVISGSSSAGSTLTSTSGTWNGFPAPTITYRWYRGTTLLTGQTNATYATQIADIGEAVTCRVTGTNATGSVVAISNAITITPPPLSVPVNTSAPVLSGNASTGSTLTSTTGTWTGYLPPTFMYQWYRGTTLLTGQPNATYVTQAADIGEQVTCRVTGTNASGSVVAISNAITITPPPSAPVNTSAPKRLGNQVFNGLLYLDWPYPGTWTGYPYPTFTYQWYSGSSILYGETGPSYVVKTFSTEPITCHVTATNASGSAVAIARA